MRGIKGRGILQRRLKVKNEEEGIAPTPLKGEYAGYVLVTCKEPTADGKMSVELTYEGDSALAAYLLDSARAFLDEEDTEDAAVFD